MTALLRLIVGFALLASALWGVDALLVNAQEVPRIEPVLGGYARPGRPFVVRATGPVVRLRAPDGPWARARGAAGDEFVVHTRAAGLGAMGLEVDTGSGTVTVPVTLRPLPESGTVILDFVGGGRSPADGVTRVTLPRDSDPPTVAEAWAPFDRLPEAPTGWSAGARAAMVRASASRTDEGRHAADPFGLPSGLEPFRAAAAASTEAPRLPDDVVLASLLAAATSVLLLVLVGRRSRPQRVLWGALPVVGFLAWAGGTGALPGAVRGTALVLADDRFALVLVRVEAVHATRVSFALPAAAEDATLLRFSAEDRTAASVEIGERVRMELGDGQHRLIAYRIALEEPRGVRDAARLVPNAVQALIAERGWAATGSFEAASDLLPHSGEGVRILVGRALGVRSRRAPGK